MKIDEIQEEIVDEFSSIDDWMDRYNYLIELSSDLAPMDSAYKSDSYMIQGCQSRVWVNAEMVDGNVVYSADSDAIIAKGLIALLVRVLSGHTPEEILSSDLYFIDKIGMKENLTPTRANGLVSMIKQMKMYALAYQSKSNI